MTMEEQQRADEAAKAGKPPLGVAPFYIPAEARIKELARAIDRNAEVGVTECIAQWAQEIIEQCRLIETLRRAKHEP